MFNCFHTTKISNLRDILENGGLQSIYGANSALTAEGRKGNVSYSAGTQAMCNTFNVFLMFYLRVADGRINEAAFKKKLSPEAYAQHQKSVIEILKSKDFSDWISDNVYLCFDGEYLSDRHEENPEDSYTSESIPPEQLKVCLIRNRKDDSMYIFSMEDIFCFLCARNPKFDRGFYHGKQQNENVYKYKNDDYYMDYLDLEQFCELFPELVTHKEEMENMDMYLSFFKENYHIDKEGFEKWIEKKEMRNRLITYIEKIDAGEFTSKDVPQFLDAYFKSRKEEMGNFFDEIQLENKILKIERIIIEEEKEWNGRLVEYRKKIDSGEFTEEDMPQFVEDYFRQAYSDNDYFGSEKNENQTELSTVLWKVDEILTKYIEEKGESDYRAKQLDYDLVESNLINYIKKIDAGEFTKEDVPQFMKTYCAKDHSRSENRIELTKRIKNMKNITTILEEGIKDELQGICPYDIKFREWRF